jgi:putative protease
MVEELNKKREIVNTRSGKKVRDFKKIEINKEEFSYVYKVNNKEQYDVVSKYTSDENIYYSKKECMFAFPRISNGIIKPSNKTLLINELSDLDANKEIIANAYLNTTNIYALYTLYSLGCKRVTLSLEMSFERIESLINNYKKVFGTLPNVEVVVYGKIDLMITKYCPINKILTNKEINCLRCKEDQFYLLDRKGYKLELLKDGLCNIRIINPKALHLIEYCASLKEIGVSKLRLEFTSESPKEVEEIVLGYKENNLELKGVTRGYFKED